MFFFVQGFDGIRDRRPPDRYCREGLSRCRHPTSAIRFCPGLLFRKMFLKFCYSPKISKLNYEKVFNPTHSSLVTVIQGLFVLSPSILLLQLGQHL